MGSPPTVSVIMNCFNSGKYVADAIKSVLNQTFRDWEIIFWDNQSTDDSAKIVKSYSDPRIKYFYAPVHTVLGEARSLAFAKASGEWLAILDCDDWWSAQKLEKQLKLAENRENLGIIFSDVEFTDKNLNFLQKGSDRCTMRRGMVWGDLLCSRSFILSAASMVKREAVDKVKGLDNALRYCEEYDLFLRIAETYEVDFVDEPIVKYRLHGENLTGLGSIATTKELLSVMGKYYSKIEPKDYLLLARYWLRYGVLCAKLALQKGKEMLSALSALLASSRSFPVGSG